MLFVHPENLLLAESVGHYTVPYYTKRLPTSPEEDAAALKLVLQVQVEMEELYINVDDDVEGHSGDATTEANKIRVRAKEDSDKEAITIKFGMCVSL